MANFSLKKLFINFFYLQVSEADYLINPSAYREVVWDIKVERKNFIFLTLLLFFIRKSIFRSWHTKTNRTALM